jgi:hypothetical protein
MHLRVLLFAGTYSQNQPEYAVSGTIQKRGSGTAYSATIVGIWYGFVVQVRTP